jgi:hypothetical protein
VNVLHELTKDLRDWQQTAKKMKTSQRVGVAPTPDGATPLEVVPVAWGWPVYGCELVPHDDPKWDAVAAARRLLADYHIAVPRRERRQLDFGSVVRR